MTENVSAVQADLLAFAAALDARVYPKAGTDVGGGVHVPPAQSRTVHHADPIKHPTLSLWRFPDDPVVQREVSQGLARPVSAAPTTIDATWFPPGTVIP